VAAQFSDGALIPFYNPYITACSGRAVLLNVHYRNETHSLNCSYGARAPHVFGCVGVPSYGSRSRTADSQQRAYGTMVTILTGSSTTQMLGALSELSQQAEALR
jgi:hypothetical protein